MRSNEATWVGSWRLRSYELEVQGRSARPLPMGPRPWGRLVLGADGVMVGLITAAERAPGRSEAAVAELFRSMLAYTGRYRVTGDRLVIAVEASWNEAWTGSEQVRTFTLTGDDLELVSPWGPHPSERDGPPARGVLRWARELPDLA